MNDDPFFAALVHITQAVPLAQIAQRNRIDAIQQADVTKAARLSTAATTAENLRQWAAGQMSSVASAVEHGTSRIPGEIATDYMESPQSLMADARAGLQGASQNAQAGLGGIQESARALLLWRARRSSILGGIGIGLLVVLGLAALFVTRQVMAARQANATATASAIAAITHEHQTSQAIRATPTPEGEMEEATPLTIIISKTVAASQISQTPTPRSTPSRTARPEISPSSTPRATPRPIVAQGPEAMVVGRTSLGTPVEAVRFGNGPRVIVFVGGMHAGFAPGSVGLARSASDYFSDNLDRIPDNVTLYIVISASPDTPYAPGELAGRLNSNGVDANRNWGCRWTKDAKFRNNVVPGSGGAAEFSESEVASLRDFILNNDTVATVFWEARAENGLVSPGSCGTRSEASLMLANSYGAAAGYRIADFEDFTNQELNGDSTNWLDSVGVPAISVLLPRYDATDWDDNLKGMLAVLEDFGD